MIKKTTYNTIIKVNNKQFKKKTKSSIKKYQKQLSFLTTQYHWMNKQLYGKT